MEINKDLIAASSTPLVLAILAEGDSYGYAILKRVQELSGGRMEWTDGMLYPVLQSNSGAATSATGSAVLSVRFLRGRGALADLERWQTGYVPVYALWAAIVVIAFPPIFRFV